MDVFSLMVEPAKWLMITLLRHGNYLFHYKMHLESFEDKAEYLLKKRDDVLRLVEEGHRRLEEPTEEVQLWLKRVAEIEATAEKINEAKEKHLCGRCVSLSRRYKISKTAMKKEGDIRELLEKSNFSKILHEMHPPLTMDISPSRDFILFNSTEHAMTEVLSMLDDPEIWIIGIYGMGGVGKTLLMKELAKKLKKEKVFDEVVMVTVSQKPDMKKIQLDMSEQLGLRLHEENVTVRARRLSARLRNEKKVLVILDDVWEHLALEEVGIPYGEVHRGCKLVLTTRSTNVCAVMECQAKIAVEVLSEEESWSLFRKNAGIVLNTFTFLDVGKNVAKECGGLPLAIVTLGRALRDKDQSFWTNALLELKRSSPSNIEGINSNVFSPLILSYEAIESEETKLFFLCCCLFPEDHNISINKLMGYMIGEGHFADVETFEEASGRVCLMLNKLKSSCLLLDGDRDGYVRMHDVVRDVAIYIASQDAHGFLVKASQRLREWQARERLDKCKSISLISNAINKLPDQPPCPQLQTLLLQNNRSLTAMPENFFNNMESLRVLDLSNTRIFSLPQSLSYLRNLRMISLNRCSVLRDVSILGHLQNLEIVRLNGCNIYKLPEEIGHLSNLRLLDLSNTRNLSEIPPKLISKLSRLEELYMGNSFNRWETREGGDGSQASVSEVLSLPFLTTLNIHVKNSRCLSKSIPRSWMHLKKFCISINTQYVDSKSACAMRLNISNFVPSWISVLLEKTKELCLWTCEGLENLVQLHAGEFDSLKHLEIKECLQLEHLICHEEKGSEKMFKNVMELHLACLQNFVDFTDSILPDGSFVNLMILSVHKCGKLKCIMSSETLTGLHNLEDLELSKCDELQEVFNFQGVAEGRAVLTKLKRLRLRTLPKLLNIFKGKIPQGSLQCLNDLHIKQCTSLRRVATLSQAKHFIQLEHFEIINFEELTTLISCDEKKEANTSLVFESMPSLKCQCKVSLPSFQNLQQLSVERCKVLQILLSMRVAQCLQKLELLKVKSCIALEEIIADEVVDKGVFPQLKTLILYRLPNLRSFCPGKIALDFPSLEHLKIWRCYELKTFPLEVGSAPMLTVIEGLNVDWFEGMEWKDELAKSRLRPLFRG